MMLETVGGGGWLVQHDALLEDMSGSTTLQHGERTANDAEQPCTR